MIDKESIYELQKIDCNCNDCAFMQRDFDTFKKWETWHKNIELQEFEKRKQKATQEAKSNPDPKQRDALLRVANNMKFSFEKSKLLQYGFCSKFNKQVSFIPLTCQLDTQDCFVHRKDVR